MSDSHPLRPAPEPAASALHVQTASWLPAVEDGRGHRHRSEGLGAAAPRLVDRGMRDRDASPWDGDVVTALEWGSAGRACWCQGSPPAPSADRTQSHGQVEAQGAPSCLLGKRQTMAVTLEKVTPEMVMLGWAWPPPPGQGPLAWPCTQQGGASGPGHQAETGLLCPWSGQLENQDICAKGPATAPAPQVGNASQDLRMLC